MPDTPAYQVLARKYRPATFVDLIGQEAMVRTLRNAFKADRIAQAFILTGIRGTGKTTTARIVAKGLNCLGPDGAGGPTTDPCGQCGPCRAIAEGRHVDVLEYDAASNTQVDKMRDILASLPYRPSEARYKILIFDEVHMLSTGAFNALLKTLEEPPPHVKFIFATTEIRKVPVTVLSRCQRFDLRRVEPEVMIAHLERLAASEGAQVGGDALALIARASEGSVRDAVSLLDQAISHGAGETTVDQVRDMLGLADRGRVLDLFDLIMRGDAAGALAELSAQYADGADPAMVLRDLAEATHWVSVIKIAPEAAEDPSIGPDERTRGQAMAAGLPMRALTRMWQMLLKALEEVAQAPNAMMAAEMAVIRLTHVADLPDPERLMRDMAEGRVAPGAPQQTAALAAQSPAPQARTAPAPAPRGWGAGGGAHASGQAATALAAQPESLAVRFPDFDAVVALIRAHRDMSLLYEVETCLRLARYAPGRIEFQPAADAAPDLAARLGQRLQQWTGRRWGVSVVSAGGAATIDEARRADRRAAEAEARENPVVQALLSTFPGARISDIRTPEALAAEALETALPEVDEEWDPFEEE